jgi:hypothetical protein
MRPWDRTGESSMGGTDARALTFEDRRPIRVVNGVYFAAIKSMTTANASSGSSCVRRTLPAHANHNSFSTGRSGSW